MRIDRDGSYEILRDAPPGLIHCDIHEPDRSSAFNKGFLQAGGTLIKPLTDDDVFFETAWRRPTR